MTEKPNTVPVDIRYWTRKFRLIAHKDRKTQRWYFADRCNTLLTSEKGLTYEQAIEWLERYHE